jgi:hypothetical protein
MIKSLTPHIQNWEVMNYQILTMTMRNQVKNYMNFNEALDSIIINVNILAQSSAAQDFIYQLGAQSCTPESYF